jgi:large subunit ribosomal protein L31
MKKDIHPTSHQVVFVDTSCNEEFVTTSTLTSEETRDIDGVSHFVLPVEISSATHPFYTGKQILVDTARRVEKFQARAAKQDAAAAARKGKKSKKAVAAAKKAEETADEAK